MYKIFFILAFLILNFIFMSVADVLGGDKYQLVLVILMWILTYITFIIFITYFTAKRDKEIASERTGESICTLVRSLDFRQLDTHIIRSVYETLQQYVDYPLRKTDRWEELGIDDEELEDIMIDIARSTNRSLEDSEFNPYYGRVETIQEIIHFLCHQKESGPSK